MTTKTLTIIDPAALTEQVDPNVSDPGSVSFDSPLERPPWPPLDPAALHGFAGEVVRAFAPFTESDDVAVLVSFLVLFGAACDRSSQTYAGEDRHGVNLFACLVGDTAKSRKGSSLAPARRVMRYADPDFEATNILGGLSSGEGLIWAVRDPITKLNRQGVQEVVDPGITDKRLACVEEEFSSVLKVMQRQGNTVSEQMRRAWDARHQLASLTKTNPAVATGHHISILAHITAEELARTLTETEMANGLGNRFLWHVVRRSKVLPNPGRLPEERAKELGGRVGKALAFARRGGEVARDKGAAAMWAAIYPDLSEGKFGLAGALMARGEAQVLRLSLLYALLDQSPSIREPHLLAALAVWQHCESSIRYLFGEAIGDGLADRLLAALRRDGPMNQSDIYEFFGRHVKSPRITSAQELLQAAGLVSMTKEETGGRPRTTWAAR